MTEARRIVLVTGGASGIGAGVCRRMAADGFTVVVADVNRELAETVAKEIGGYAVTLDVTDPASVSQAYAEAEAAVGVKPLVLVNVAGWDELMPFLESTEEFSTKVIEINYNGVVRMARVALPAMVEASWGRIVNVASDAGRVGSMHEAVYSGAKGGVIAFSKTLAREFARYNVTVNSVCPGPTDTPLLDKILAASADSDRVISSIKRSIPMRRLGTPDDLGPAVTFLASEGASFITGQTLSVSGGLTMA